MLVEYYFLLYNYIPISIRIVATDVIDQLFHRLTLNERGVGEHGGQQVIEKITSYRDRIANTRYLYESCGSLLTNMLL